MLRGIAQAGLWCSPLWCRPEKAPKIIIKTSSDSPVRSDDSIHFKNIRNATHGLAFKRALKIRAKKTQEMHCIISTMRKMHGVKCRTVCAVWDQRPSKNVAQWKVQSSCVTKQAQLNGCHQFIVKRQSRYYIEYFLRKVMSLVFRPSVYSYPVRAETVCWIKKPLWIYHDVTIVLCLPSISGCPILMFSFPTES